MGGNVRIDAGSNIMDRGRSKENFGVNGYTVFFKQIDYGLVKLPQDCLQQTPIVLYFQIV